MSARLRRPVLWLACVVTWVALWGDEPDVGTVLGGGLVGLAVVAATPVGVGGPRVRPVAGLRFAGYFLVLLVRASLAVAWEVVTPRSRVREGIVAVRLAELPDRVVTILANAISLTPGTLTIEVERAPLTLYVHVLHLVSPEQTRADVARLAKHVGAMFGCREPVPIDTPTGGGRWRS